MKKSAQYCSGFMVLCILLFVVTQERLFAQMSEIAVETISVEQGLSQSTVFSVIQDERGRLWIATADGLDIYDGYEIKVLRNSDPLYANYLTNTITSLAKDSLGNMYIGTSDGLSVMNIRTHRMQSIIFPQTGTKKHAGSIDYLFIDSDETLWACGNDNLYYIDLKKFRLNSQNPLTICSSVEPGGYSRVKQFSDGTIYAVGPKSYLLNPKTKQLSSLESKTTAQIFSRFGLPMELSAKEMLLPYSNTELYVFNKEKGTTSPVINIPQPQKGTSMICEAVRINDSVIVLGTQRAGVFFYNQKSGAVTEAECNEELGYPPITQILNDKDGNIWVGCAGGGGLKKMHFTRKKFHRLLNPEVNPGLADGQFVKAIAEIDADRMMFGYFNSGLIIYNRKTGTSEILNKANLKGKIIPFRDVFAIYRLTADSFLIGTSVGVLKLSLRSREITMLPKAKDIIAENIWCFNKVNDLIYVGSGRGLSVVTDSIRLLHSFDTSQLNVNSNSVSVIHQYSQDELLLGTYWRGIIRYNFKTKKTDDSLWKSLIKAYPKSALYIKAIHRDKAGNLWVAAQNVLFKVFPSGKIQYFSETQGLANSFMYGLLEDNAGNIWVSTNKGISRISRNDVIRNYRMEDGLQSWEFNTGAFVQSSRGEFFFGGIGGINYFYPDSVTDNQTTPKAFVTAVVLNNEQMPDSLVSQFTQNPVTFAFNQNSFAFTVSGMVYNNNKSIQYAFFLDGFDRVWTLPSSDRHIRFTNLDPGTYRLLVKTGNEDGVWSEAQVVAVFTITPPFWYTVWFISFFSAFSIALIVIIIRAIIIRNYKKKLQKIREEQLVMRERERIARDLHDELGATLTSVSMRVQIMQQTQGNANAEAALNASISNAIRKLDEIVWTVNPSNDDMQNLFGYITEFAQEFFENSTITYRFDFPQEMPAIKFTAERRYNIFLIVKEALNNVQKYSEATTVLIRAEQSNAVLRLAIIDNGRGFSTADVALNSNGLRNMQKRAEMADAKVTIESSPGNGTTVLIEMALTV